MIPLGSGGSSQVALTDFESMTVTVKLSGASGAVGEMTHTVSVTGCTLIVLSYTGLLNVLENKLV